MEIERLNLYRDSNWNDLQIRFCGHSRCLPLHAYGPGTRPYYLMHFVFSGRGRLVVNRTEYQITQGQLFLVEPNQMVYYQADKEDPWEYGWVGFRGGLAAHFVHRLGLGYPTLTRELPEQTFTEIRELLQSLIEIKNDSTSNDLYTNGLLLQLLSKVGTNIEEPLDEISRAGRQSSAEHVQNAISIVEDFYGRNLTVQDIADRLSLNRSYLSTIFARQMGASLKKYIVDFRISQSEEFLFTSNWSVDYISRLCGFSSPSYFSQIFKEYHGISPTEYRSMRHKRERQTVLVQYPGDAMNAE